MSKFNLHTVIEFAEDVENDVRKAVADFHDALQKLGFKVTDAKLTSDTGITSVTPAPVEPVATEPEVPAETEPEAPVEAPPVAATEETPPAE